MKTPLALPVLLPILFAPTLAAAGDAKIVVDDDVPFTETQLAGAVQLRAEQRGTVRVSRKGQDLVVDVDGVQQVVSLDQADDGGLRVVAMVVVSLARPAGRPEIEEPAPGLVAPAPMMAPPRSPWLARATIGFGRDDGGTFATPVMGSLAYELTPRLALVASAGVSEQTAPTRDSRVIPLRLGIEARTRGVGLELGGAGVMQQSCTGATAFGGGVYATARAYAPISPRFDLVLEVSGYYMTSQTFGCDGAGNLVGEAYGGQLGAGFAWRL